MSATQEAIGRCVRGYRLGMEGEGASAMVEVIDGIMKGVQGGRVRGELLVKHLQGLMQAQARGDFLYLADVLEYEIAPILLGCE